MLPKGHMDISPYLNYNNMMTIYDKLHKKTHHINTAGMYNQTMLHEYKQYMCEQHQQ